MALSRRFLCGAAKHTMSEVIQKCVASFRTAVDLGFVRGQCGEQGRPDILDDSSLSEQAGKKTKAFTYVGEINVLLFCPQRSDYPWDHGPRARVERSLP